MNIFLLDIRPFINRSSAISSTPLPDFTSNGTFVVFLESLEEFTATIAQKNKDTITIKVIAKTAVTIHLAFDLFFFEVGFEDNAGCILVDDFSASAGETLGDS